jgi:hypothetical protein
MMFLMQGPPGAAQREPCGLQPRRRGCGSRHRAEQRGRRRGAAVLAGQADDAPQVLDRRHMGFR